MGNARSNAHPPGKAAASTALNASDLLWQSYRSLSRMLLETHNNFAAYMAINRSLMDEMQPIVQRSHDLAKQMSEKALARMSAPAMAPVSVHDIQEAYDVTTSGIRELSKATLAAQFRYIEAIRDHASNALHAAIESRHSAEDE